MIDDIHSIIRAATLELLGTKEYKDIQMKEIAETAHIGRRTLYRYYGYKDEIMTDIVESLMDELAKIINQNGRMDLEGIAYSYFSFWEKNIYVLKLLKKAHLMYLLEDNLPELVIGVALKTKYRNKSPKELKSIKNSLTEEARYNYFYMLAGYVKIAQLWMEEEKRKSPIEMARIMKGIVMRDFPGM